MSSYHQVMDKLFDVKEKLTDREYKEIVDLMGETRREDESRKRKFEQLEQKKSAELRRLLEQVEQVVGMLLEQVEQVVGAVGEAEIRGASAPSGAAKSTQSTGS